MYSQCLHGIVFCKEEWVFMSGSANAGTEIIGSKRTGLDRMKMAVRHAGVCCCWWW